MPFRCNKSNILEFFSTQLLLFSHSLALIKSVVAGQTPVILEWKNTPGEKLEQTESISAPNSPHMSPTCACRPLQTANHFGTPLKVYGRDNNRHREGRRNFVEHVDHEDPVDKSKRSRVRFNVEGPHGHGMAYAEVRAVCSTPCLPMRSKISQWAVELLPLDGSRFVKEIPTL